MMNQKQIAVSRSHTEASSGYKFKHDNILLAQKWRSELISSKTTQIVFAIKNFVTISDVFLTCILIFNFLVQRIAKHVYTRYAWECLNNSSVPIGLGVIIFHLDNSLLSNMRSCWQLHARTRMLLLYNSVFWCKTFPKQGMLFVFI